jgi:type IV pilus assembly protein PilM
MPAGLLHSLARRHPVAPSTSVTGPIGLELGNDELRMVQLTRRADGIHLTAQALVPCPGGCEGLLTEPGKLRRLLKETLRAQRFRGREVVTCMRPSQVRITMLNYVVPAGRSSEQVIVQRMAERVDGPLTDYVLDYVPVRVDVREGQEHSALVAAARREQVIDYLEALRRAGLSVRALDIGPLAIRRLVTAMRHHHDHDNVLIITLGQARTYMTVLSGRRLIFDRDISFGEQRLIRHLSSELDVDDATASRLLLNRGMHSADGDDELAATVLEVLKPLFVELRADIDKAMVYAASETHGNSVRHIYLTGAVGEWAGIEKLLGDLLDIPVSVLDPTACLVNADRHMPRLRMGVVTGLALRGLCGDE